MAGSVPTVADAALGAIRGGTAAQRLLRDIRQGVASPDALHDALQAEIALADPHRLQGFCREIGKALERATT